MSRSARCSHPQGVNCPSTSGSLILLQPPHARATLCNHPAAASASLQTAPRAQRGSLQLRAAFQDVPAALVEEVVAITAPPRPAYVPGQIADLNYVRIFDTTLRDGEQSPGATMTGKEKLDIARQLARLGVDIIEAGFPVSSPDDFDAVRSIAMDVGCNVDETGYVPVICGLSRTNLK